MKLRNNKNKEQPEEIILQENIKTRAEATNIAIFLIIVGTAIAVTGVFLDIW